MKSRNKFNRRGVLDDFFDFMFTVLVGFLMLIVLTMIFNTAASNSRDKSLNLIADFHRVDSAISNLRVRVYEGQDLEAIDIGEKIRSSRVLGGKTITDCVDYFSEADCVQDSVALFRNRPQLENQYSCEWNSEKSKCYLKISTAMVRGGMPLQ